MGNKEDWKELEKWAQNDKLKKDQKYKIDIDKVDIGKRTKKIRIVSYILGRISRIAKIIMILIIALALYIFLDLANGWKQKYNADVKGISQMYNIKTKTVLEEIDERGNGKYVFQLKDNKEIQFTVFKKFGNLREDYLDNSHKYYFENWNAEEKDKFKVVEKIQDNLLYYETYIEIEDYSKIEEAAYLIYKFTDDCGKNYKPGWKIFFIIDKYKYSGYFGNHYPLSKEANISYMKQECLKYLIENNIENDISEEEFEKYLYKEFN